MRYTFDCHCCGKELEPSGLEMMERRVFCDSCGKSNIIFSSTDEALREVISSLLERIENLEERTETIEIYESELCKIKLGGNS